MYAEIFNYDVTSILYSINFYIMYFETILLDAYKFRIFISPWSIKPFMILC